jgi:ergothioneine biosynthesis protein EgtB
MSLTMNAPRPDPTDSSTVTAAAVTAPAADVTSYRAVRSHTESLATPLGPEDQVVQSMPDASPTKWHRAHTTWFFEEFVLSGIDDYEPFDPSFRYLFNSYYEAVGPRQPRPRRGMITRPDINEVAAYRHHVDSAVATALSDATLGAEVADLVVLGLNHEQQHQELLLMDALHLLSQNPTNPVYEVGSRWSPAAAPGVTGLLEHDGGLFEIGHDPEAVGAGFAYDNESPPHRVWLEPFAVEDRLVTCGEWLGFIEDGGYSRPDLWLSDGWHHARAQGWDAPAYWRLLDQEWHVFGLAGQEKVDPAVPVANVSYYEADAFARWRTARLPTETEWEVAARLLDTRNARDTQFFGHLWQWTASAYAPYPGFRPVVGAVGEYNGKFMVDQQVLRGSSFATPAGHERTTYRNFFPSAARWAFGGVRIAHDND